MQDAYDVGVGTIALWIQSRLEITARDIENHTATGSEYVGADRHHEIDGIVRVD